MGGRWGGSIRGARRRRSRDRRDEPKQPPRIRVAAPSPGRQALVAAAGFYLLTLAGAILATFG